jgi:hypothetical protein
MGFVVCDVYFTHYTGDTKTLRSGKIKVQLKDTFLASQTTKPIETWCNYFSYKK